MKEIADKIGYTEDGKVKGCNSKGRSDWHRRQGQSRRPITLRDPEAFTCTHKVRYFFVKLSLSLNQSLSLRDRDIADTIITLYHTSPRPKTFLTLRGDL